MTKKNREAPISYRPPETLREEFRARVEKSGLSVNAFITQAVFASPPPRQSRRPAVATLTDIRTLLMQALGRERCPMIPKASQRVGGQDLATHLLNALDNEYVEVAEVSGAAASDLHGAFAEWEAIATGLTKCREYLYSLSVNPEPGQQLTRAQYLDYAERVEKKLGLQGQAIDLAGDFARAASDGDGEGEVRGDGDDDTRPRISRAERRSERWRGRGRDDDFERER